MTDHIAAPADLLAAEYKQLCGDCGYVTSITHAYCPACGRPMQMHAQYGRGP